MESGMSWGREFSRRQVLAAGAVLTVLTACSRPNGQAPVQVEDKFAALEDRYNAKVGIYGRNLGSNRTLGYRADDIFATCSTFKAYVAAAILQKVQQGELKLTNEVFIDQAMLEGRLADGVLREFPDRADDDILFIGTTTGTTADRCRCRICVRRRSGRATTPPPI